MSADLWEELQQLARKWENAQINRVHQPPSPIRLYGEGVEEGYSNAADDLRAVLSRHPELAFAKDVEVS